MATVYNNVFTSQGSTQETVAWFNSLNIWNWSGITTDTLWVDAAKTIGLKFIGVGNIISLIKDSTTYHASSDSSLTSMYVKVEKTTNAVIISVKNSGTALSDVSATDCDKYIVCNATNSLTRAIEPIIIYLGSKSSSNQCMMLASDVNVPTDMAAQNSNANVNAKTTNLIPFYNTASVCVTSDILQSLCEDISSWYFGDVIVNDKAYRMSGSVFALDE